MEKKVVCLAASLAIRNSHPNQPERQFRSFTAQAQVLVRNRRTRTSPLLGTHADTIRVRLFHHAMASCSLPPHHDGGV